MVSFEWTNAIESYLCSQIHESLLAVVQMQATQARDLSAPNRYDTRCARRSLQNEARRPSRKDDSAVATEILYRTKWFWMAVLVIIM